MKTIYTSVKTEKKLNEEIAAILTTIRERYPELTKYIGEMPVKTSYNANDKIHNQNLSDYYESLKALQGKYGQTHTKDSQNH